MHRLNASSARSSGGKRTHRGLQLKQSETLQEYNFSMKRSPSTVIRWAAPFILVGLAAGLDAFLTPLFSQHSPLFLVAIGIAGWFFGVGPAILATVLSLLALASIFWPDIPLYGGVFFAVAATALTILIESQRAAHARWREKDALAARLLGEYERELLERKRAQAAELRHSMWLEVTLS